MTLPEILIVGDAELLFLGLAIGAGAPEVTRRIPERRYGVETDESEESDQDELIMDFIILL